MPRYHVHNKLIDWALALGLGVLITLMIALSI